MQSTAKMPTAKKTVLITGGSRGLGLAMAQIYKDQGHQVITPSRAELDLANLDQVKDFCKNTNIEVDVLINNAGINSPGPLAEIKLEEQITVQNVNCFAPLLLAQHFSKSMRINKWGRIVNIGSIFSVLSRKNRIVYSSSKFALSGMTKSMALELASDNVLVNCICPGFFKTEMTTNMNSVTELKSLVDHVPMHRLGNPEELARYVYFIGSDENTFITGQDLLIDGGLSAGLNL
jgi:3-oxoacyl-[acyl-carrier protein] reductase